VKIVVLRTNDEVKHFQPPARVNRLFKYYRTPIEVVIR